MFRRHTGYSKNTIGPDRITDRITDWITDRIKEKKFKKLKNSNSGFKVQNFAEQITLEWLLWAERFIQFSCDITNNEV